MHAFQALDAGSPLAEEMASFLLDDAPFRGEDDFITPRGSPRKHESITPQYARPIEQAFAEFSSPPPSTGQRTPPNLVLYNTENVAPNARWIISAQSPPSPPNKYFAPFQPASANNAANQYHSQTKTRSNKKIFNTPRLANDCMMPRSPPRGTPMQAAPPPASVSCNLRLNPFRARSQECTQSGGAAYRQNLNPMIYNSYRSGIANPAPSAVTIHRMVPPHHHSPTPAPQPMCTQRVDPQSGELRIIGTYFDTAVDANMLPENRFGYDKTALFKTELCSNWMLTERCNYGSKCHFAHGVPELRPRVRTPNYKSQPCCDPTREGARRCMYSKRCNYCHPGEAIRRPHPEPYYDQGYYHGITADFGVENTMYPFGIYV